MPGYVYLLKVYASYQASLKPFISAANYVLQPRHLLSIQLARPRNGAREPRIKATPLAYHSLLMTITCVMGQEHAHMHTHMHKHACQNAAASFSHSVLLQIKAWAALTGLWWWLSMLGLSQKPLPLLFFTVCCLANHTNQIRSLSFSLWLFFCLQCSSAS